MSEIARAVRCPHCRRFHDEAVTVCPKTGLTIQKPNASAPPPGRASSKQLEPSPPSKSARRSLVGETIAGKYDVTATLGEGGMGSVFEAIHSELGRRVAVKVLHPYHASRPVSVQRFRQEARAAGAIGHPCICEIYDIGMLEDGSPFLVMERLTGKTLADRISKEGGLPYAETVDILVQTLSGLIAAHDKGIVHRDIKPENIFLAERAGCPPIVKILDFGVSMIIDPHSQMRDGEMHLTRTGMVMGTPFYMSPEQARGERNLDSRVDVYACGVMLYEALTGRRPFVASNYNALLMQILTARPKRPSVLRPGLPAEIDTIIARSMARAREDRYSTAGAMQQELRTLGTRDMSGVAHVPQAKPPSASQLPTLGTMTAGSDERPIAPQPQGFDDMPTEVQAGPMGGYDDAAATEVRADAVSNLRKARKKMPSAPDGTYDPDATIKMDPFTNPADDHPDLTEIKREVFKKLTRGGRGRGR